MNSELITKYFPALSPEQADQFSLLGELYHEWNTRINVISRKDIGNLYERHVLHSLGIAKVAGFKPGTRILDAGTGGGFPGIPLAIMFPESNFHLVDSIAKKLAVVKAVAEGIGLHNLTTGQSRLENHAGHYDFVVSRAVATLEEMTKLVWKNILPDGFNEIQNGILYLKGGDIKSELESLKGKYRVYDLNILFEEEYFLTKKVIHIWQ